VVAETMGITRIYPVEISVEDYYYPVYRVSVSAEAGGVPAPTPATPITPSEVEVTARVRIVYAF